MKTLFVKDRGAWRAWLEKNFATSEEIWVIHSDRNERLKFISCARPSVLVEARRKRRA